MKDHIYDEQNSLHHIHHSDGTTEDLGCPELDAPTLGKYGRMRQTYLKENKKIMYNQMLLNDTLWPHLLEVDQLANEVMDTIVDRMKRERGITEQLKASDQWRWIQEMDNIHNAAEEFVLREVVYH